MIFLKSDREIEKIRVSAIITAEILEEIKNLIKPGLTTGYLDNICEELVYKKGAIPAFKGYRGYPKSLCVSINEEVVHGIPGKRRIKEGDIVSLDFGVLKDNYYGDMALTIAIGEVTEDEKKLIRATEEALYKGIEKACDGNRLGDISYAIESHVTANGFSVVRDYVGHGIGRNMHEEPQIPNFGRPQTGPLLKAGMVFAIEPMVNMGSYQVKTTDDGWTVITKDGKPSAHFEHTVLITKEGPEVLTCLKKI